MRRFLITWLTFSGVTYALTLTYLWTDNHLTLASARLFALVWLAAGVVFTLVITALVRPRDEGAGVGLAQSDTDESRGGYPTVIGSVAADANGGEIVLVYHRLTFLQCAALACSMLFATPRSVVKSIAAIMFLVYLPVVGFVPSIRQRVMSGDALEIFVVSVTVLAAGVLFGIFTLTVLGMFFERRRPGGSTFHLNAFGLHVEQNGQRRHIVPWSDIDCVSERAWFFYVICNHTYRFVLPKQWLTGAKQLETFRQLLRSYKGEAAQLRS